MYYLVIYITSYSIRIVLLSRYVRKYIRYHVRLCQLLKLLAGVLQRARLGAAVGPSVGARLGAAVGPSVEALVDAAVGPSVEARVGAAVVPLPLPDLPLPFLPFDSLLRTLPALFAIASWSKRSVKVV